MAAILNFARSLLQVILKSFQSIQHPENPPSGHSDHQNWPTGAQHIDI